jgi:hypothetical protein
MQMSQIYAHQLCFAVKRSVFANPIFASKEQRVKYPSMKRVVLMVLGHSKDCFRE